MTLAEILVTIGGIILIALILWYFFWSEGERVRAVASGEGVQEIEIQVKGGYDPDLILVEAGRPVRLDFHRNETADCSEEIVFGDFGIRKRLPAFQTTPVEFTPERPGEYVFTCGMGMLRGKLLVEPGRDGASRES
ncbi:MAG TPA: cupredoxin domain-containing protein [Longimicrobiaceae bacterium]|nr:cupredoxin domain-containing protein [Longimicrobiaceae bacterium]